MALLLRALRQHTSFWCHCLHNVGHNESFHFTNARPVSSAVPRGATELILIATTHIYIYMCAVYICTVCLIEPETNFEPIKVGAVVRMWYISMLRKGHGNKAHCGAQRPHHIREWKPCKLEQLSLLHIRSPRIPASYLMNSIKASSITMGRLNTYFQGN